MVIIIDYRCYIDYILVITLNRLYTYNKLNDIRYHHHVLYHFRSLLIVSGDIENITSLEDLVEGWGLPAWPSMVGQYALN